MTYASFSQRLLAHNIDLLPLLLVFYIQSMFFPNNQFDWLILIGIYMLYNILFELSKWKATPGKSYSKLMIKDLNGENPKAVKTILRNLLKIPGLLFFFAGFIMIIFTNKKQGFHDYISKTIVINKEQ